MLTMEQMTVCSVKIFIRIQDNLHHKKVSNCFFLCEYKKLADTDKQLVELLL